MAVQTNGVFGFEYLEDAELDQSDVVGCASTLEVNGRLICDLRRPEPMPLPGPIVIGTGAPIGGSGPFIPGM